MQRNSLISIIVPVYNVEQYLNKCIESIINQSYNNIELILVDDGSTDSSSKICDEYKEKYDFIKVIHKKNGGLSDARNKGIEISTGKYITFIDSDDYINEDYIDVLYTIAHENNADILISKMRDVYDEDEIEAFTEEIIFSKYSKNKVYIDMFLQNGIDVNACAKLYKREIFDKIKYPVGKLYEDIQVIDKIIEKSDTIVVTNYMGYNYLQRTGSIMYGKMSKDRMILIDTTEHLIELMDEKYPDAKLAAIKRYVYCNFHVLGRSILDEQYINESKIIKENILKYKKHIFLNNVFSKKEKFATIVLIFGLKFYKFFWKLYCKKTNKVLR